MIVQLFVQTAAGATLTVELDQSESVGALKGFIANKSGIPSLHQRFFEHANQFYLNFKPLLLNDFLLSVAFHTPTMDSLNNRINAGYYLHRKKLGEGGFGKVELATHLFTKQKVAVKIIDKSKMSDDFFETELHALKQLNHKKIPKFYQFIESHTTIYLIMEYCPGGELLDFLAAKKHLNEWEAKKIFKQLVQVLGYVHSKGFAHRDIKPENILIDDQGNIKLIDFGLAANSQTKPSGLNMLSSFCGTPAYIAPEILKDELYYGPAVDVWSSGVVLYVLLAGKRPFSDSNISQMCKRIESGAYEMPTFFSSQVQDLIYRMLELDPDKRITIPEILDHPWLARTFDSEVTMSQDTDSLDDVVVDKCASLFSYLSMNKMELRHSIKNDFGYLRATYRILCANPSLFSELTSSQRNNAKMCARRRSRSFSELSATAKVPKVGRRVDVDNLVSRIPLPSPLEARPIRVLAKPKTDVKKHRLFDFNSPAPAPTKIPVKTPAKNCRKDLFGNKHAPTPVKSGDETPKFTQNKNNRMKLLRDGNKENSNVARALDLTPQRSYKNCENKSTISVFRSFLEATTPAKSNQPPTYSNNNNKLRINLCETNFYSIEDCLSALTRILDVHKINYEVNNYTIRGVISSHNIVILVFDLSLMVCRETGKVSFQRNRIKGLAHDYLRICRLVTNNMISAKV